MSALRKLTFAVTIGLIVALFVPGCSRAPAVQFHNLRLVSSLRTALSARNPAWLDGVARAVDARRSEGEMDDDEYAHFNTLIEAARRGEWQEAERECYEFEVAQLSRSRDAPQRTDDHKH